MENTKKPLSEVIQNVINANNPYAGSMYTKEDVLRILNEVETNITDEQIEKLKGKVASAIDSLDKDEVCDGFEFEIKHGDTIAVDSFTFDTDTISDEALDAIDDFFRNL